MGVARRWMRRFYRRFAMNVHHLELFYYVAKYGGISAAVRRIPYGIQQPAVSGQMGKLEEELGAKLFERSPFRLTPAGERLFAHVQPFFEGLGSVATGIRTLATPELRIGGAELVLRDHIPAVMKRLKAQFPGLRFSLRTGLSSELETWLRDGELDVALTVVDAKPPARLKQLRLTKLALVLLVPVKSAWRSADELWARRRVEEPLICLPATTVVTRVFQRELKRRNVSWPNVTAVTSLDLIGRYVANGDGIGLSVAKVKVERPREVRVLPLEGFASVAMGVLWRGEPSELLRAVIEEVSAYTKAKWPGVEEQ